MRQGDTFDVGVVNGCCGRATVEELSRTSLRIRVEWGAAPPLPPPAYLLVGMCRPATARKILTTAPTLGVRGILFAGTGRSDPAYADSRLWQSGEYQDLLIKGTEQAFDTHVPELLVCGSLRDAFEQLPHPSMKLLALDVYEGARSLSSVELQATQPVCLAVGPERGWNANDRKTLNAAGFELVALNQRVLRVETAVTVGLTLVLSAMGVL